MRNLLSNRDFTYLWLGQSISRFGDGIHGIALSWLVLDLTGSPLTLGVTLSLSVLPALCFGLFIGSWVDRWQLKRVLILSDIVRMSILLTLILLLILSHLQVGFIMVSEFILALFSLASNTARSTALPLLVPKEMITAANSLNISSRYLVDIGGRMLGGFIVLSLGVLGALIINMISFASSLLFVVFSRFPQRKAETTQATTPLRDIADFFVYLRSNPQILRMIGYLVVVNVGIPAIIVELPVIAKFRLENPAWLGFMHAAFSIGGVLSGLLSTSAGKRWDSQRLAYISTLGFGISLLLLAFTPGPILMCAVVGLCGLFGSKVLIHVTSFVQKNISRDYVGRAMAFQTVTLSVFPVLGLTTFGTLTELWSPHAVLVLSGFSVVFLSLACALIGRSGTTQQEVNLTKNSGS